MSQLNPIDNLEPAQNEPNFLAINNILDDALMRLGRKGKPSLDSYPDYYDDILQQIIDTVPLE